MVRRLKAQGEFIYDYKYDILTFKLKGRRYKQSFEFQNYIIDLDTKGYVTGIRIQDASAVSGIDKYVLKNLVHGEFNATVKDNVVNVRLKFVARIRNKMIPLLGRDKDFVQQFTSPVTGLKLADSEVTVPEVA